MFEINLTFNWGAPDELKVPEEPIYFRQFGDRQDEDDFQHLLVCKTFQFVHHYSRRTSLFSFRMPSGSATPRLFRNCLSVINVVRGSLWPCRSVSLLREETRSFSTWRKNFISRASFRSGFLRMVGASHSGCVENICTSWIICVKFSKNRLLERIQIYSAIVFISN